MSETNEASKKTIKWRKISEFHIDFINSILDRILTGEINTNEALKLLEEACKSKGEKILTDPGSVKRIVEFLLEDKPEQLELYKKTLEQNVGKRGLRKETIGTPKPGEYHLEEKKIKTKSCR